MRIILITGSFPPMKCGVGDYTALLAAKLAASPELEIGVLTSREAEDQDGIQLFRTVNGWGWGELSGLLAAIRSFKPDLVHLQYPTRGYGTSKMPVFLPCILRRMGIPVVQTWHEIIRGLRCLRYLPAAVCLDALTVIEPDYGSLTQSWFWKLATRRRQVQIPVAANIPHSTLSPAARTRLREELSGGRQRLVAYFGFAAPPKGIETLFSVADPATDHLLLVCELSHDDPYQASLLRQASNPEWCGNVTVTGYQDAARVADLLAAADVALFPFTEGATARNASVMAATRQGTCAVTTSSSRLGYDACEHVRFVRPGDLDGMRSALHSCSGMRSESVGSLYGGWDAIAAAHVTLYREVLEVR